ncbi:MAG: energy transducer TonB [Candidatus Sulfotelmatobacter sp.]
MREIRYEPQINSVAEEAASRQKGLLRRLLALALLAVFVLVVVKYHDWFRNILAGGSNEVHRSKFDTTAEEPGPVSPAKSPRTGSKHGADAVQPGPETELTLAPGITGSVVWWPPEVEVISGGNRRRMIRTHSDSISVDLQQRHTFASPFVQNVDARQETGEINAAEKIRLSPGSAELASPPAFLASQQTKMEGVVMLLARIGKDGSIQDLQVIRGPEVLSAAALEAVKQWHFQPYYESGRAVEKDAQITVRFAISSQ